MASPAATTLRSLKGMVAMVSGGASGLGEACVERFVREGGKALIADINVELGEKLVAKLGAENAAFVKMDSTKEDDVKAAVEKCASTFGKMDAMINCAGVGAGFKLYDFKKDKPHSLKSFDWTMQINTYGVFNCMRYAAGLIGKNEPTADGQRGVIVNTSSIAAFEGQKGQLAYSGSKGAMNAMTLPSARDLAKMGIRVNTITPGLFSTPLLHGLPDPVKESLNNMVPCPRRLGHPDEFAHFVQFMVENPYINGCVVRFDGCLRMPDTP